MDTGEGRRPPSDLLAPKEAVGRRPGSCTGRVTVNEGADMRQVAMNRIATATLFTITIFILTGCASRQPTLQEILDRNVESLGGREAIEALGSRRITGRQIDDRPYAGPPVTSVLSAAADSAGRWSLHLVTGDEVFSEGCDEAGCWIRKPGEEVRDQERTNAKLAYLLDPHGPLRPEKHFPGLRLTGTRVFEGVTYWMVENDLKYEHYTLYFEVESGLLSRVGFHWWLEDWREVDGVLVPGTIVRGRKGGSTNLYFDEVVHGGAVDVSRDAPASRGRNP